MYAVAGVSGHTGRAVADALIAGDEKIRVVVRDAKKGEPWKARGAEVAVAPLEDPQKLAAALKGVQGAYLLCPPNVGANDVLADRKKIVDSMVQAARESGVPHVVFLSSVAAHKDKEIGPIRTVRYAEKAFTDALIPATFLRAAYFIENLEGMIPGAQKDGVLPSVFPADQKFPMIAARDIARAAVRAFKDGPPKQSRILELSGPEDASNADVAKEMSKVLSREVKSVQIPEEQMLSGMKSFGFSDDLVNLYREFFSAMKKGQVTFEGGGVERVTGREKLGDSIRHLLQKS